MELRNFIHSKLIVICHLVLTSSWCYSCTNRLALHALFDKGYCWGISQWVQVEAVGRIGNGCWKGTSLLEVGEWLYLKSLGVSPRSTCLSVSAPCLLIFKGAYLFCFVCHVEMSQTGSPPTAHALSFEIPQQGGMHFSCFIIFRQGVPEFQIPRPFKINRNLQNYRN